MKVVISFQPPFIPIIKALQDVPIEWVTLQPQMAKMLQDMDIKAVALADSLQAQDQGKAGQESARVIAHVYNKAWQNPGIPDVSYQFLRQNLPAYLFPRMMDVGMLLMTLDRANPDLIVVHNDVEPVTRVAAAWARTHEKPCLHIPHAVYMEHDWMTPPGTDIHDIITASHIAVSGPYQEAWYQQRVRAKTPVQIRQTGLPQFDAWAKPRGNREQAQRLLQCDPHRPVIVYASSWRQDTNLLGCHEGVDESYIAFLAAMKNIPGLQVIVKTHPRAGNEQWHVDQANKAGVACTVTGQHLEMVLQVADVLISYGPSNVVLEAASIGRIHLAAIHGFRNDPEVTFIDAVAGAPAIQAAILKALNSPVPDTRALIHKYWGQSDGLAHARIAEWIKELAA